MSERKVTREEFNEAFAKASDEFLDISMGKNETPEGAMTVFLMGLQNVAFASLLEKHLFGEEPTEEDTTITNEETEKEGN